MYRLGNPVFKENPYCNKKQNTIEHDQGLYKEEWLFYNQIWRVRDVARFLGCSMGHIYNLVSDEKIPKIKKGKFVYFIPNDILEWVSGGNVK